MQRQAQKLDNCRGVEPRRGAGRRDLGTCVRRYIRTHPTHQSGAKPHSAKKFTPPNPTKKLPPRAPAPCKAKQHFAMKGRVLLGEVLGGCGRFGGRGSPLSRGLPLPPRSSPPPRSFSQTIKYLTPSSDSGESAAGAGANAFFALRSETGTW